ncbi:hypothetical protein D1646_18765 [Pseudoflavonifractor sp. 60]|uniref:hypothetical protein n=1 Tax=Pseudoflavonifractor sp. 60 TaxID=2304576 RepID=UPI00136D5CF8|nr:hypothetical protein [Pseudoflavonifractor sp. 60]NBI68787.1 hypothetical protein [Pseudoflavonifractor sp. 60]
MAYTDPFLARGISISPADQEILNRWHDTTPPPEGCAVPKLMTFEEAMDYDGFLDDCFRGFPGGESVFFWDTDDISAVVGYYYTGPLKGTVYMLHGPTDISPEFFSLARFRDYYCRVLRDFTDRGDPNFEDKFWHNIDFNDNQPMTPEETAHFHQAAQELVRLWKAEDLREDWYENMGFCVCAVLPDCFAGELIPFLHPKEDEYVLEVLCHKLVRAKCVEALPAMEELAKAEARGLRIGGWSDSRTARWALGELRRLREYET